MKFDNGGMIQLEEGEREGEREREREVTTYLTQTLRYCRERILMLKVQTTNYGTSFHKLYTYM